MNNISTGEALQCKKEFLDRENSLFKNLKKALRNPECFPKLKKLVSDMLVDAGVEDTGDAEIRVVGSKVRIIPDVSIFWKAGYEEIAHKVNDIGWGKTVSYKYYKEEVIDGIVFYVTYTKEAELPDEEVELLKGLGKLNIVHEEAREAHDEISIFCPN